MLRYALFDLDNTLYPQSCGLWDAIGERINLYMIKCLAMPPEDVRQRREGFLRDFGTTLNALRRNYEVDPDEFLTFVHDLPLSRYLRHDPALDQTLRKVPLKKSIFTNADARHARRVLAHLGISHHFEWIIDIHSLEFVNKPNPRAYDKALDIISAQPQECILVEDTMLNLAPARELGMITVLIGDGLASRSAHFQIRHITDLISLSPLLPEPYLVTGREQTGNAKKERVRS